MKLIKKLSPKYINGRCISYGIFWCDGCNQEIEKDLSSGNKAKSCSCQQYSDEVKQKLSNLHKGKKPSEETKQKIKQANLGKKRSEITRQKMRKPKTEEHKQKMSESHIGLQSGENNPMYGIHLFGGQAPNWSGGISFEPYSPEFNKEKKLFILERDNYTCQAPNCEHKINKLHVHHIDYDKKNNSDENLITLCHSCHTKTNGKNKRVYFTEFYKNIMVNKI